ncbi:hypothetical protein [Pseudomonas viridiflava]
MVDFKLALKKGLDAAGKAEANRQEIESVLKELNEQLWEETEGKLEIVQERDYKDKSALARAAFVIGGLTKQAADMQMVNYLSCKNPSSINQNQLKLSEFRIGRAGYPCELKVGDEEMFCEDKQAFEEALGYLLSDTVAAEKMYKVMQYELIETDSAESDDAGS